MIEQTYLTTDELSAKIKYDSRTIRDRLKDSVLLEGRHYIRPFGGRKVSAQPTHLERTTLISQDRVHAKSRAHHAQRFRYHSVSHPTQS
ncbi:MAG: hypothetical protein KA740_02140, partial [Rhodoferax sp.]|nr:hypothetical protein [Rhodoferax sp.]